MPQPTELRILLFGANGQLGHELGLTLATLGHVIGFQRADADLSSPESLRAVVGRHRPQIIVNAAAHTAVEKAESEPDLAHAINALAPGVLAEEAQSLGACLVHYSSDYVFDGRKDSPYMENDSPNPQSVYGRSKLSGERAVAVACRRHLIFRTSWVVGAHGRNFLKTILRLAAERDDLRVVADQHGAPTSAALIADTTARVLQALLEAPSDDARWGLYHLAAAGETSWHGYARHVIARARELGMSLRAAPDAVVPIMAVHYPSPVRRPANSRLNTTKLRSAFALDLPDWKDGVDRVLDQLASEQQP